MKKIPILFMALAIPLGVFAQAPQNPQTYIINVGGKNFEIMGSPPDSLQPTVMDGITVYVQKPPAVFAPVKILDPGALPTASAGVTPSREDRSRLTPPVLRVLPANVPTAPPQAVMPKDLEKDLRYFECIHHNTLSTNPYFECMYNGKPLRFYKFGNPPTDSAFQRFDNVWHVTERKDINPFFEDIQAFYAQGKPVPFNTALPTPMPAVSVPRFYTRELMAQINAGEVRTSDGSPISPSTLRLDLMFQQPGYLAAYVMTELKYKDTTNARNGENHNFMVPYIMKGNLPRAVFPGVAANQPSISQIFQGQQGPASRPVAPVPQRGGLGGPVGGGGGIPSAGGIFGSIGDMWAQSKLGKGEISAYVQAVFLKGGAPNNGVSSPALSPDGKAYYFYFNVHGVPFALVTTDFNKDGVYEMHPVLLKYDPKFPGIAFPIYEFPNEKEMEEFIVKEINSRALSTPAKK